MCRVQALALVVITHPSLLVTHGRAAHGVMLLSNPLLRALSSPRMDGSRAVHTCRMRRGLLRALLFLWACATTSDAVVCTQYSGLPCDFGECTFSKDGAGALSRLGSCASTAGTLRLNNNGIQSLPVGVFNRLMAVTSISLSGNTLTILPVGVFNGLPALQHLHLYNNKLSSLSVGVFDGLAAAETLYLDGNALTSLPAGVFNGLTALQYLTLQYNKLTSLPAGMFDELTALKTLYLFGNTELFCVPMLAAHRSRLTTYSGPEDTCAVCTSPNATNAVCFLVGPSRCDCTCNVGFVGGQCTECMSGKYKTGNAVCESCGASAGVINNSTCAACPANSNSLEGSSAATACTCNAGWTGPGGGPCSMCATGKYKTGRGSANCESCPAHSSSSARNGSVMACTCNAGAVNVNFARACGGASNAACSATQSTQFDAVPASTAVDGSIDTYFHTLCLSNQWWRVDFGQERHIELVQINNRVVGHIDTLGRLETSTIRVGNTDTYDANAVCAKINGSHDIYSVACNSIGRYLFVVIGTTGSHACLHFTELEAYGACTQCVAGKYKADSGNGACENCPANSGSPAGGIACTCNAGFTDIHGGVCHDTFSSSTDNVSWYMLIVFLGTCWFLLVVAPLMAFCYVRYRGVSIRIPIPISIVLVLLLLYLGAVVFIIVGSLITGSSKVVVVMFTLVVLVLSGLGGICYVRYRRSSNTVSPDIQESENTADGGGASEQRNLPRTLALSAGWRRGVCAPLELQETSVSVDESESQSSLNQQTSLTILGEELNLFQTALVERAQLHDTEDTQGLLWILIAIICVGAFTVCAGLFFVNAMDVFFRFWSVVVVGVVVGVVVCLVLGLLCHVRCRGSSKTVSPAIQEGGDSAGGEAVFEQHNQPRTLASNTGWVEGECNPLAILSAPLSFGQSESLQQHTSSTLLKEEVNLLQKASIIRARLQNTEDSQSLDQLKQKLDRIKTTGQAEEKHRTVKENRIYQLEKEIREIKEVSQEAARRKKTEDDARFLELELLLTAVLKDEVAVTTKRKEDLISNSKEKDLAVSHSQPRQGSQCVICLHAEAVMALMPCRHLCVCESPACMLQQCPICRAPVVEVRRIYSFDR